MNLKQIAEKVSSYTPQSLPEADLAKAGVLIALTDSQQPELILTRRATHLATHSGEVAFPGGKYEPQDRDLSQTALRESHEEIGLAPTQVELLGAINPVISRFGYLVTPYVGIVPEGLDLVPNQAELDAIFRVPLSFFLADQRARTDEIHYFGRVNYIPCWHYQGYEIWGLTAYMISDFINIVCDAGFDLSRRPNHGEIRTWPLRKILSRSANASTLAKPAT